MVGQNRNAEMRSAQRTSRRKIVDGGSWIEEKAASSSWLGLEVPVRPWNILFQVLYAGAIQFAWEIKRFMRKRLTLRSAIHDPFTFAFIRGSASFFKASSLRGRIGARCKTVRIKRQEKRRRLVAVLDSNSRSE
jgi:hypothetical protein